MALRMHFVTSQCTVRGLVWLGEAHLIIWKGVVDCDHKIQHQFVIDVNILIKLSIILLQLPPRFIVVSCDIDANQIVTDLTKCSKSLLVAVLNAEKQPLGGLPSALYPPHTCWGILLLWGGVGMGVRAML